MNKIIRRRTVRADQLNDGVLLDFDDNDPSMISEVKYMDHKVLFKARGIEWSLDHDEMVQLVIIMRVVG